MKKTYDIPELKVALLEKADVIVTSKSTGGEFTPDPNETTIG